MNFVKILFAQLPVSWTSFAKIVVHRGGDSHVSNLSCIKQFHIMAFAQLICHESPLDIEACLLTNQMKLHSMAFLCPVKRTVDIGRR